MSSLLITKAIKPMNASTQGKIEEKKGSTIADTVLGFVILGLLAAGGMGLMKASGMSSGLDVLLCLMGSVAAFTCIYYILFGKE